MIHSNPICIFLRIINLVIDRLISACLPLFFLLPCSAVGEEYQDPGASKSSLAFSDSPYSLNPSSIGEITITGIISGLGFSQTNAVPENPTHTADISNTQAIIRKNTGELQFYLQTGYYSTSSLGTSYQRANRQTIDTFGAVPLVYLAAPIGEKWKLIGGKINSFGGYEETFTYQNINIDRGLLWNQTSNVSKGVELDYASGDFTAAFTLNDGFYSNELNWMGASAAYSISEKSTATLSWTGSIKASSINTIATPLAQNNSQIFNASYTYKSDRWMVAPYLQYTYIPTNTSIGILAPNQTMGAAVLVNYRLTQTAIDNGRISLPFRFEYITSNGNANKNAPNLLYGPSSGAWSATITPTYQMNRYFTRIELSYVQTINATSGLAFGSQGNSKTQSRAILEAGVLF